MRSPSPTSTSRPRRRCRRSRSRTRSAMSTLPMPSAGWSMPTRSSTSPGRQARRQRGGHRLARAVRAARALSPALRAEGHDSREPDRQGGLSRRPSPMSPAPVERHEPCLPGRGQRHERAAGQLRSQGRQAHAAPLGWTQGSRHRRPADPGHEARAGRQADDGGLRGAANGLSTKGQVRFGADSSVQQVSFSQFALGRTNMSADWRRGAGGVDVALRGRSLELRRVRAMLKAREDLAKANARRRCGDGAREHALHCSSSTASCWPARQPGLPERAASSSPAIAWPRPISASARARAAPSAVTPAGAGPQRQRLCRRFRRHAEGNRLARRAGRRLSRFPRPLRRHRGRRAARRAG